MSSKGSMSVSFANKKEISKKLNQVSKGAQKALDLAVKDTVTRAPAQVTKAVTNKYNIKKSEMTAAGKLASKDKKKIGTIRVKGQSLNGVSLTYRGRRLTPLHFGMRPTSLPARKNYKITVEVFKGNRKRLQGPSDRPVFLGSNGGASYIPFQRTGAKSHPIFSVKAVGIPQMIDNKDVRKEIDENVAEVMKKRYEHQSKRVLSKIK